MLLAVTEIRGNAEQQVSEAQLIAFFALFVFVFFFVFTIWLVRLLARKYGWEDPNNPDSYLFNNISPEQARLQFELQFKDPKSREIYL